jgi:hypothetical protein
MANVPQFNGLERENSLLLCLEIDSVNGCAPTHSAIDFDG